MTHQTPPADARSSAWIGAHERLTAAQKLKVDAKNRVVEPLPEIYWATLAEAAILADLARADQTTGLGAGGYLVARDGRIETRRSRIRDGIRAAAKRHQPADPPFADCMRVTVTGGDYAGRRGTITKTYPSNEPPLVDVALDLRDQSDQPVAICALPCDLELDGVGFVR